MQRQYPIQIYTIYKNQIPKMSFVQNDTEANRISFELFEDVDVPMTGIIEATATVKRPDNKTYTYGMDAFEIVNNLVTFILPPSATYAVGKCSASVSLYDTNMGRLTTQTFTFDVTETLISDTPIDSTNEYPILTELINDVRVITDEFKASGTSGMDGLEAEVILARKGEATLKDKIDKIDIAVDTKVNKIQNIQTPTFLNGWTNNGAPFETAKYWKDDTGVVHLQGTVIGGTSASIFKLPVGYLPLGTLYFTNAYVNGSLTWDRGMINIASDGTVQHMNTPVGNTQALNGITFLAEQ